MEVENRREGTGLPHVRPDWVDIAMLLTLILHGRCAVLAAEYPNRWLRGPLYLMCLAVGALVLVAIRLLIEQGIGESLHERDEIVGEEDSGSIPEEVDRDAFSDDALAQAKEVVLARNEMNEADLWSRQAFMAEHRKRVLALTSNLDSGEITEDEFENLREVADRQLAENMRKLDRAARGL